MNHLTEKVEKARREGRIADINILEQEIYQAQSQHPGAFKRWADEHPGLLHQIHEHNQRNGGAQGGGTSRGGGTAAGGRHNRRRRR